MAKIYLADFQRLSVSHQSLAACRYFETFNNDPTVISPQLIECVLETNVKKANRKKNKAPPFYLNDSDGKNDYNLQKEQYFSAYFSGDENSSTAATP